MGVNVILCDLNDYLPVGSFWTGHGPNNKFEFNKRDRRYYWRLCQTLTFAQRWRWSYLHDMPRGGGNGSVETGLSTLLPRFTHKRV